MGHRADVAATLAPAFAELLRQAPQGEVLHNDDTTVKILEQMGRRGRPATFLDDEPATSAADDAGVAWPAEQLSDKGTEPTSALGHEIGHMLGHWDELTLFLREPGAPLDNNASAEEVDPAPQERAVLQVAGRRTCG